LTVSATGSGREYPLELVDGQMYEYTPAKYPIRLLIETLLLETEGDLVVRLKITAEPSKSSKIRTPNATGHPALPILETWPYT
jgi:hypothetical protein